MKTAIDAVNHYKGNSITQQVDAIHFNGGFFHGANNPDAVDFVCSFDEYTDLVYELCINFGRISLKNLRTWQKSKNIIESPIYTKAMANHNVLPLVGMKFRDGFIVTEPDSHGMYVTLISGVYIIKSLPDIKPLTPPIELIDGERYHFVHEQYGGSLGIYNYADEKFYNWDMWVVAAHCTNIQLLEVKS